MVEIELRFSLSVARRPRGLDEALRPLPMPYGRAVLRRVLSRRTHRAPAFDVIPTSNLANPAEGRDHIHLIAAAIQAHLGEC